MKSERLHMSGRFSAMALLSALALPPSVAPVDASVDAGAYARLNAEVVERHVWPRYRDFAETTASLDAALDDSCQDGQLDPAAVAPAYHAAVDSWMAVQHLRFGPALLFLRADRVQFWPDKRGRVGRHLTKLLSAADPASLDEKRFASGSVAVQGLPALERLVFTEDAAAGFACPVAVAIGANLASIAAGLRGDWGEGPDGYAAVIRGAATGNVTYLDAREATLEFAKALRGALTQIADQKLDRPLGKAAPSARHKRAESWRSARSLRNIRHNLQAAEALYDSGEEGFAALLRRQPAGKQLDGEITATFARLQAGLAAQPDSFAEALRPKDAWQQLDDLRRDARGLMVLVGRAFGEVLDLPLGFNSFDGD